MSAPAASPCASGRIARDLETLAPPGLVLGHRAILPGDELALREEEAASMSSRPLAARRASGAARLVARALMERLGLAPCAVPRARSGAPVWPAGIAGSLAHDDEVAIAALARSAHVRALGIDIEPAAALPADMLELIATPKERARLDLDPFRGRLLFVAKEAVYKAVYPRDRRFLEFHDIEVDLMAGTAAVRDGATLALRICATPRLVAIAVA